MSYIRGEDREQASFLPADDYVGAEAAVRVIDAFAESLDVVRLGFVRAVPAATDRRGYDPRDLLKLYVYGYLNEIRSSRKLERECRRNVELMWLPCDGWLRTSRRLRTSGGRTGRESWGRAGHSYCSAASRDCLLPDLSRSMARSSVLPRARSGLWASGTSPRRPRGSISGVELFGAS
jgi:hypothetical protein